MKVFARAIVACLVAVPIALSAASAAHANAPWIIKDLNLPISSDPSIVSDGTGSKIFYRASNGHLWYVPTVGVAFLGTPVDLGGAYPVSAPSAVTYLNGGYRVFYRNASGHLMYAPYDGGQWWRAPVDAGAAMVGAPSAVGFGPNLKVVYRGPNSHLFLSTSDGVSWSPSWDLGGVALTTSPTTVIPSGAPNSLRTYYRSPTGTLMMSPYDGGAWWGAPVDLGGSVGTGVAAFAYQYGIDVAYGDATGQLIVQWCDVGGSVCAGAWAVGAYTMGTPTIAEHNGRVFFRGSNGNLWEAYLIKL